MRIAFTGASSKLGAGVLAEFVRSPTVVRIYCGVHRSAPAKNEKIEEFPLDLANFDPASFPRDVDLLVHLAAVTHASDPAEYERIVRDGTLALARAARAKGCRRMLFVSTRCAGRENGAYGRAKLEAEEGLRALDWPHGLVILRPSEVYGAGGREGIDQFVGLARSWRLAPMLFGDRRIRFSPLHADDFVRRCAMLSLEPARDSRVVELCGPESFDGVALALRLSARFWAVPVPIWWPLASRVLSLAGLAAPDQAARLVGRKTSETSSPGIAVSEFRRFP
ncbi:MAG: NAD(P)-dependent oxidoreductase [Elusimicrobia bacterium]|nr:NAD(P)-dependent oxidoreductase [Elusimicrobiota bacterium]